jgi:hypothetical protein
MGRESGNVNGIDSMIEKMNSSSKDVAGKSRGKDCCEFAL